MVRIFVNHPYEFEQKNCSLWLGDAQKQMALSDKVAKSQIDKAVDSLIKFIGRKNEKSTSLIEDEDFLYLVCYACSYACLALHNNFVHFRSSGPLYLSIKLFYILFFLAGHFIEENTGR